MRAPMPAAPSSAPSAGRAADFAVALLLFLGTCAAHAPLLETGFYADDWGQFREIFADLEAGRWPLLASSRSTYLDGKLGIAILRPGLEAANAGLILARGRDAEGRLRGPAPFAEHAASVVLKGLVVALLFAFARRLGCGRGAATLGAAFAALHPAAYNATAWVAARGDLAWVATTLAALLAAVPPPGAAPSRARPWWAAFWVVVGLLCKETAVVGAGAVVLALVAGVRRGAYPRKTATAAGVALGLALFAYFRVRSAIFGDAAAAYPNFDPSDPLRSFVRNLAEALPIAWMRLVGGRAPDVDDLPGSTVAAWAAVATFAGAAVLCLAALLGRPGRRFVALALLGLAAATLPPLAVQPKIDLAFSRLLVGWSGAFALLFALAADRSRRLGAAVALATAVAGVNFVYETAATRVWCGKLEEARRPVAEAAAAGGSPALVLVHAPPRAEAPPGLPAHFVPDWTTEGSFRRPHLGIRTTTVLERDARDAFEIGGAATDGRRPTADPRPTTLARGYFDPADGTLRFRTTTLPRFSPDLPAEVVGVRAADGSFVVDLPAAAPARAYPAVAVRWAAAPAAKPFAIVLGVEDGRGAPAVRRVAFAPDAAGGGAVLAQRTVESALGTDGPVRLTVRLEGDGGAAPTLLGAVASRVDARVRIVEPADGTAWSLAGSAPTFVFEDGTGLPFVRLALTMQTALGPLARTFVAPRAAPAETGADGRPKPRVVRFAGDGPGESPAALLRLAAEHLFAAGEPTLEARVEAAATPDGPAEATSPAVAIKLRR
jgi:hypothetical protein